ncbi:hypothetical protein CEV31_3473 [Brucella thiophenivorans]|uniref:Uncharacterized protein n=1 Tax=Brucella thiophenivorans TaxID=571255 RepID=A0A256FFB1_9HYPH|nr:hypothetical protein CEV31_3473 [Brucella thiophenivorans]
MIVSSSAEFRQPMKLNNGRSTQLFKAYQLKSESHAKAILSEVLISRAIFQDH